MSCATKVAATIDRFTGEVAVGDRRYWSPELGLHRGRPVTVRVSEDRDMLVAWSEPDGAYLASARCIADAAWSNSEAVRLAAFEASVIGGKSTISFGQENGPTDRSGVLRPLLGQILGEGILQQTDKLLAGTEPGSCRFLIQYVKQGEQQETDLTDLMIPLVEAVLKPLQAFVDARRHTASPSMSDAVEPATAQFTPHRLSEASE